MNFGKKKYIIRCKSPSILKNSKNILNGSLLGTDVNLIYINRDLYLFKIHALLIERRKKTNLLKTQIRTKLSSKDITLY
jgi:hypothetical protein